MPLKAIYEKAPLMPLQQVRLSYGQVRSADPVLTRLYALCEKEMDCALMWEGMFALACLTKGEPLEEPVAKVILKALENLENNDSLSRTEQIACARAALAVFEYNVDKEILKKLMLWCARLETEWDEVANDREIRQHPADLMDFLVRLYRLTGKKVLLRMCTRLRASGMDWAGVLNTFSQPRPLKRTATLEELERSMAEEEYSESGFYTRKYLSNTASALADGMRFARQCAVYNGSGLDVAEKGFATIRKQHGAVCGGTSADRLLEGTASHRGISAEAIGAWCEALAGELIAGKTPWAAGEVLKLYLNAVPAAVTAEGLVPYQHVNELRTAPDEAGCFDPGDSRQHRLRSLARLSRGCAAVWHSALSLSPNGLTLNLPLDGHYVVSIYDQHCVLQLKDYCMTIRTGGQIRGQIGITIPSELDGMDIRVNDESAYRPRGDTRVAFDRAWEDGDTISLILPEQLRVVEGHHQGISVYDGMTLLAMPADETNYAKAACGTPVRREGKVFMPVKTVKEWTLMEGNRLSDIQVLPKAAEAEEEVELKPYASLNRRIALFPKGKA